ncbi:hypothetical protein ACFFRR_000700 [Megaselia abdita]
MEEHRKLINNKSPTSGLAKHALENQHHFKFENVKAIDSERSKTKREFKEACHIFANRKDSVNIKTDTRIISKSYHPIIHDIKSPRDRNVNSNHNEELRVSQYTFCSHTNCFVSHCMYFYIYCNLMNFRKNIFIAVFDNGLNPNRNVKLSSFIYMVVEYQEIYLRKKQNQPRNFIVCKQRSGYKMDAKNTYLNSINITYNRATKSKVSSYFHMTAKIAKHLSHRTFLLRCKSNSIIPSFIMFCTKNIENLNTVKSISKSYVNMLNYLQKKLLNLEIKKTTLTLNLLRRQRTASERDLRLLLNENDLLNLISSQDVVMKNILRKQNYVKVKKYDEFSNRQDNIVSFDPKCIRNTTNVLIPEEVNTILSFGPKFNLPVNNNNLPIYQLMADVEDIINEIPEED